MRANRPSSKWFREFNKQVTDIFPDFSMTPELEEYVIGLYILGANPLLAAVMTAEHTIHGHHGQNRGVLEKVRSIVHGVGNGNDMFYVKYAAHDEITWAEKYFETLEEANEFINTGRKEYPNITYNAPVRVFNITALTTLLKQIGV